MIGKGNNTDNFRMTYGQMLAVRAEIAEQHASFHNAYPIPGGEDRNASVEVRLLFALADIHKVLVALTGELAISNSINGLKIEDWPVVPAKKEVRQ